MMVMAGAGDKSLVGVMISWTKNIPFERANFLCDAFESIGAVFSVELEIAFMFLPQ